MQTAAARRAYMVAVVVPGSYKSRPEALAERLAVVVASFASRSRGKTSS
jgi:hypothetical protein